MHVWHGKIFGSILAPESTWRIAIITYIAVNYLLMQLIHLNQIPSSIRIQEIDFAILNSNHLQLASRPALQQDT